MKTYTISLTLSIEAENKDEAFKEFKENMEKGNYDHDSIEIEEEAEED